MSWIVWLTYTPILIHVIKFTFERRVLGLIYLLELVDRCLLLGGRKAIESSILLIKYFIEMSLIYHKENIYIFT